MVSPAADDSQRRAEEALQRIERWLLTEVAPLLVPDPSRRGLRLEINLDASRQDIIARAEVCSKI